MGTLVRMAPVTLAQRATRRTVRRVAHRVVGTGAHADSSVVAFRPQGRQSYADTLRTLSEASVDQCFNAFKDIDWDAPALAVAPDDDRWILPLVDQIGAHPWYRTLPKERQREIGRYRFANICKVGAQFEQVLIAGISLHLIWARNGNPEFRYATHEVTEETHHTQMFQESVNRICPDVAGAPLFFKMLSPLMALAGPIVPVGFLMGILAGEEPIDHLQKNVLRAGGTHPLVDRVMQIHVAEEARHIGFAHQYLEHHIPRLAGWERALIGVATPLIMRALCDAIMRPSSAARRDMGIPKQVAREIWWGQEESRKALRDMFGDVRMLCDELGLRPGRTVWLWRALGIEGRPSRFRSQPTNAAA